MPRVAVLCYGLQSRRMLSCVVLKQLTCLRTNKHVLKRKLTFSFVDCCRFLLLLQLVALVRVHSRWVSTKLMPADYLTRSETLHLGPELAEGSEQPPGRPPGASNPAADGLLAAPSEASDDAALDGPSSPSDYSKVC